MVFPIALGIALVIAMPVALVIAVVGPAVSAVLVFVPLLATHRTD